MSDTPTPEPVALLACPFCGGEAIDCTYNSCDCCNKAVNAGVMCTTKGCRASTDHHDTEAEAAAAWNTRAATVPQGVSVPDGWVLVPRESTSAMDWAGAEAAGEPFTGPDAERVWIAMIAAATTPPPAELGRGS